MDLSFRFLTFVCSHPFRAKRDTNYSFESVSVILLSALGVVTAFRKCGGTYDDFVASAGAGSRNRFGRLFVVFIRLIKAI